MTKICRAKVLRDQDLVSGETRQDSVAIQTMHMMQERTMAANINNPVTTLHLVHRINTKENHTNVKEGLGPSRAMKVSTSKDNKDTDSTKATLDMKTEDLEMIAETTDLGSHQFDQHHHNQLKSIIAVDSLISEA